MSVSEALALPAPSAPPLAAGNVAEIFAHGDAVLKLYKSGGRDQAFIEAANIAVVASLGLPVPAVHQAGRYGDRWGLVMDRAPGEPLAAAALSEPGRAPEVLAEMVRLQCALHAVTEPRLPPLRPRLAHRLRSIPLDEALRTDLLARLETLPDSQRICHGDLHPFNLIGAPGIPTMIIDWLDATCGPPPADACRSYLLLRLGAGTAFADPYLSLFSAQSGIAAVDILAWLPILAAARLAENAGHDDELRRLAGGGIP